MNRPFGCMLLAAATLALFSTATVGAQDKTWGTVKGKIVWKGELPAKTEINVTQDKDVCLANGKLYHVDTVVNPKNKGVKGVFIWLAPATGAAEDPVGPIHPSLKDIPKKDVILDQPNCMFMPNAIAIREGQNLVVKNPAPFLHNIKWTGNPDVNPGGNQGIPPGRSFTITELKAQKLPLMLECSVHSWMKARLGVFSHPYFVLTDEDGNFEIPNAPAGKFRLFAYQDIWRVGGNKGRPIEIKSGVNDLGSLEIGAK